jgi:UDP-N-acetylglucosamine diphosphorylase/glucosamine-1-phosphate N-acetyltransferase
VRICLFEDRGTADLAPLTLTRPASDLLCGLTTLGHKQKRHFGARSAGVLCRPALAEWLRTRDPGTPINDPAWLRAAPAVLVNTRWLPPHAPASEPLGGEPFIGTAGGEVAFAALDTKRLQSLAPTTIDDCFNDWLQVLPRREVGGTVVRHAWDLIDRNGDELIRDFDVARNALETGCPPPGFGLLGRADRLFVHSTARVEPMVVADTTRGPVFVGEGAVVTAFTRLEGPCAIESHAQVLGAHVRGGTTVGPHCRVAGEVEGSVLLGHADKAHAGYLGHSYVGEWAELAAGTTTADTRFDGRPVRVHTGEGEVSTGRAKVGSVIGDHAQTGVGVLLDCGTTLGCFAQVLPTGELAPRLVPAFHRTGSVGLTPLDADRRLEAADATMRRRGRALPPQLEAIYRAIAGAPAVEVVPVTLPLRKSA